MKIDSYLCILLFEIDKLIQRLDFKKKFEKYVHQYESHVNSAVFQLTKIKNASRKTP